MQDAAEARSDSWRPEKIGIVGYVCLVCLCLFTFLPGIGSLPPIDRDEARFVQATKQMAETGDYVDIRFQDVARHKKPIGIYWLQSVALTASGSGADAPIWAYRTVSLVGATLAVLATAWIGAWMFGRPAGFVAGVGLAGAFMLGFEARIAKTDAMLLATAVVAQAALARVYVGNRHDRPISAAAPWLFWIAQAAAILIKGPVVPLLSALTIAGIAVFDRQFAWLRNLKPIPGMVLLALLAAPWFAIITWRTGGDFLWQSLGVDALAKITSGQESHGAPPGTYFVVSPLFAWPFVFMAFDGLLRALNQLRTDPRILFCCAWILPYYGVFELISTKLPNYILPIFPSLFLLMGWALLNKEAPHRQKWRTWLGRLSRFGLVTTTLLIAVAFAAAGLYSSGRASIWGLVAVPVVMVTGLLGFGSLPQLAPTRRAVLMTCGVAVTYAVATTQVLPNLRIFWLSSAAMEAVRTHRTCDDTRLISAGFHEPSLVFLAGTQTVLTDGQGAARIALERNECDLILTDDRQRGIFVEALSSEGLRRPLVEIEGINYSNGKRLTLVLYGPLG